MARQSYFSGHTLSREQVAQLLYQAGFRGDDIWKMIAIGGRESHYDPGAHGTDQPRDRVSGDRGLFQINYVHDDALRQAGIISQPSDLFDPLTNVRAAYYLFNRSGLSPWNAGPGGFQGGGNPLYGTDPMAAQAAYNNARDAGWSNAPAGGGGGGGARQQRPETMADIAQGLGNLGAPGYKRYGTDPRGEISSRHQAIMLAAGIHPGPNRPPDPTFFNWAEHGELESQYAGESPHLQAFERWTTGRYGGKDLGTYDVRPVRGGTAPSTHSFGAAWDWQPDERADADKMIDLVTKNPGAFGIQAIHDYKNSRIWRIGREGDLGGGWQHQAPGSGGGQMGSSTHLHFETNPDIWNRHGKKNWKMMGAAAKGRYSDNSGLTPEQWGAEAARLGNRGNPLFEDYATIGPNRLERRQARYTANTPGQPGGSDGPPSQALTTLLQGLGIRYPNAPTPNPSLMAYLSGVGLDLSTAEDLFRTAKNRIRRGTQDSRQDIKRAAGRATENITTDLVRRGVLSSGEANKRYTRHAQDVAEQRSDLATQTGELREDATFAYSQSREGLIRDALQRIADLDTEQQVQKAANRATKKGYRQATQAAQDQSAAEREASESANQQLLDFLNRLYLPYQQPYQSPTAPRAPAPPLTRNGPR